MIRSFRDADLEPMLDVWQAANAVAHPFMDDAFVAQERRNIPEVYMPHADTWIFDDDGTVRGFLALIGNEVGAIFVDPAHHGAGIGRALMDHARTLHEVLEVEVFEVNAIGRRFYDRYGFTLLEKKHHEPTDQPVLRLQLSADAGTETP